MKNLMIYINPDGFDEESEKLTKLQIDNSLELGWKTEDILFVTNFPYEYRGVKSVVIDGGFCDFFKEGTKITALVRLFDLEFFGNELYWCHDLDAYQLEVINEGELSLEGFDAGFCDYQRARRWQLGSFFFKKTAGEIFKLIAEKMRPGLIDEEAFLFLTDNNINNINSRIKKLNGTYDFGMRRVDFCYDLAEKPLKVLHFHPHNPIINTLAIAMYGKNGIHKPLMNERLIKIFNSYGYA